MERKSGFYWVKYDGEWRVAEYISEKDASMKSYGGVWGLVGKQQFFCDHNFDEIDETPILRNE